MKNETLNILALPLEDLHQFMKRAFGKGVYHAEAAYKQIFKLGNPDILAAPEFINAPKLSKALAGRVLFEPGEVVKTFNEDHLTKFITRFGDGLKVESVIIPMNRHYTLCVSSQVGCKMGCAFCETAQLGFKRSLSVSEIVGQVWNARHTLGHDIKNLVFMGMGEPFDNFEAVMTAIKVVNAQKGFDIALRHITISTSGLVPGIDRLSAMDMPNIRLAVSINGPDDAVRSNLMPVNNRWNMAALKHSLMNYRLPKRGVFLFEYILIKGVNDTPADAKKLAAFIHPLPVRLNLIPYNPIEAFAHQSPCDENMHQFADILTRQGIFVIKRWSKGRSVSAGCGQLGKHLN